MGSDVLTPCSTGMACLVAAAVGACSPSVAFGFIYRANETKAQVVDAKTGAPVEGALVIANWQLVGGLEGGVPRGQIEIQETFTDASGRFVLHGWGPRLRFSGHASIRWPQILIFKPGYKFQRLLNQSAIAHENTPQSEWNGRQITLERASDPKAYTEDYGALNAEIDGVARGGGDQCAWQRLPRALQFLASEDARLAAAGSQQFRSFVHQLASNAPYFAGLGCPIPAAIRK